MTIAQITSRLLSRLHLRPGEGAPVALLMALAFCIGLARLLTQTAAGALFLLNYSGRELAYVYVSVAVVVPVLGLAHTYLETRLSLRRLVLVNLGSLAFGLAALGGLSFIRLDWAAFGLAVWYEAIWTMTSLALWGLAGRLFKLQQAKRLFGLISAGEVAAAMLGGLLAPALVGRFGLPSLLTGALAGLAAAFGLAGYITRRYAGALAAPEPAEAAPDQAALEAGGQRRYVRAILALAMLSFASFYLIDNLFYRQVELRYTTAAELAGFLGPFWAVVNTATLLSNLFLVRSVILHYRVRTALLILPSLTLATTAVLAAAAGWGLPALVFGLAVLNNCSDWVFRETLYKTALLILYQPLPLARRLQMQTRVESIGQPLAQGLAGLALLGLGALGFQMFGLTVILIGLLGLTVGLTFLVGRDYGQVLVHALARRQLTGRQFVFNDQTSLAILRRGLSDPRPGAALYALQLLDEMDAPDLVVALPEALAHPVPAVRAEALACLERRGLAGAWPVIRQQALGETDLEVRGIAWRVLAGLAPAQAQELAGPDLSASERRVHAGLLAGLWRSRQSVGRELARQRLNQLSQSEAAADRILAAQVMGLTEDIAFTRALASLLDDPVEAVRRAALPAAGALRQISLWPAVVRAFMDPGLQAAAWPVLAASDESALLAIRAGWAQAARPVRVRLIRVLGRIGGSAAIELLKSWLIQPDAGLRSEVLRALRRAGYRADSPDEIILVERAVRSEAVHQARWLAECVALEAIGPAGMLRAALLQRLEQGRARLFALLTFSHDAHLIARVQASLAEPDKHGYGLEVLEQLLAPGMRRVLAPLLDEAPPAERLSRLTAALPLPVPVRVDYLSALVDTPGPDDSIWIRACAQFALDCMSEVPVHPEETTMLALVEKVLILKTVGIFADTPDNLLGEIAALLQEMELPAGARLFEQGETGQCLYIIVDGRLKVHAGDFLVTELGEREIVGEMAVLDAMPRMASVTALETTRLLRLDQDALYELMADQIDVARGIIHVLSNRLRGQVQVSMELSQRQPGGV